MRRIVPSLVVLALIVSTALALVSGCSDDNSRPNFSRLSTSGSCGVAPFEVEFLGIASGGEEGSDPTGANMWYEIVWDFGDGGTATGSKVYHTFQEPDTYRVRAVARDDDGDEARIDTLITVLADTLSIFPVSTPPAGSTILAGRDTLELTLTAETCGLDPEADYQYTRFLYRWQAGPIRSDVRNPRIVFPVTSADTQWVHLAVEDPALAVVRRDSLMFVLQQPTTRQLDLYVDMTEQTVAAEGVHVSASFNDFDPSLTPMADPDGDRVWHARVEVAPTDTIFFRFINGTADLVATRETLPNACRVTNPPQEGFFRRVLMGGLDRTYRAPWRTCPGS
ncbi:MAG: PKD domain-containing protein [Candidatus Krumholzibacteriia bacterium]